MNDNFNIKAVVYGAIVVFVAVGVAMLVAAGV